MCGAREAHLTSTMSSARNIASMASKIRSAGCLIIGDEVLNGKILDTNSHEFAKFCFDSLSVPLKKTIVCGDDIDDIKSSLDILRNDKCDFIVTSGGIGSTHDDITYEALAQAFNTSCHLDDETVSRMHRVRGDYLDSLPKPQREAFYRMATIPVAANGTSVNKIFIDDSLWVPIVEINSQVYVLPGVPQLFKRLLAGLSDSLKARAVSNDYKRVFVKTKVGESTMAPFLSDLQNRCNDTHGAQKLKVGSYPHMNWKLNTVSLIADKSVLDLAMTDVVHQVVENVNGTEISPEEEEYMTVNDPPAEK